MSYRLYHISRSRLAFGTNHGSTLCDSAKCLPKVFGSTYERNLELALVNMVNIISRRKNLALINIVDLDCFQNLCFHKMSDSAFCHNRNGNCFLDSFDHFRVAHSGNAACRADVCRNALQCHNGTGTCFLCDFCLLRCGNIHDNSAF